MSGTTTDTVRPRLDEAKSIRIFCSIDRDLLGATTGLLGQFEVDNPILVLGRCFGLVDRLRQREGSVRPVCKGIKLRADAEKSNTRKHV